MYTIPFPTAVVPFTGGHPASTIAPLLLSRQKPLQANPGLNPDPACARSGSAGVGGVWEPRAAGRIRPRRDDVCRFTLCYGLGETLVTGWNITTLGKGKRRGAGNKISNWCWWKEGSNITV